MPHKRAKRSVRDADKAAKGYDNAPVAENGASVNANDPYGGMSKTVWRILNADKIRKERRERMEERQKNGDDAKGTTTTKKRKFGPAAVDDRNNGQTGTSTSASAEPASKKLRIQPGENLRSFNDRVEKAMKPEISSAIKQSKAARQRAKAARSKARQNQDNPDDDDNGGRSAALSRKKQQASGDSARPPPRREAAGKERASEFAEKERLKLNDIAMAPPDLKLGKRIGSKKGKLTQAGGKELPVSLKQKHEMEVARQQAIDRYRQLKARQLADTA